MNSSLIRRHQLDLAEEILTDTPVLIVLGPRQVGKTTLVRELLAKHDNHRFLNLDDEETLLQAEANADGFADQLPDGILAIDEIQRLPRLLISIKAALERNRRPGRFVVTGSAALASLRGKRESLAGRCETIELRGLSAGELTGVREDFASFVWSITPDVNALEANADYACSAQKYGEMVCGPCFPEPRLHRVGERNRSRWLRGYVDAATTTDVLDLASVRQPERLEPLLHWFSHHAAEEFTKQAVATDLELHRNSIDNYVDTLRHLFLIDEVRPWYRNQSQRLIKKPKIYVQDTGLAADIVDVGPDNFYSEKLAATRGRLVENFVAEELLKQRGWSDVRHTLYHFRDRRGHEVDLVLERRNLEIVGVEVKAATSIKRGHFKGLAYLQSQEPERFHAGVVLYLGTKCLRFGPRLWAMPLSALWAHPSVT